MIFNFNKLKGKYGYNLAEVIEYFRRRYEELLTSIRAINNTVNNYGTVVTYDIWVGTQVEYDALGDYDDNTIYFIEEVEV